jgi:fructoselysine-6-P-deglycase FrlB-like protein
MASSGVDDAPRMRRDIERQPLSLTHLAVRSAEFVGAGARHVSPGQGGRLFVMGCGDGLFAAQAARGLAQRHHLDWWPVGALDLLLSAASLRDGDRVIAVSMSGNVDRTVEAAHAVAMRGVPLVALVNGNGGRLAEIAPAKIFLQLPDLAPFLCGTASYTCTLAALMMLAAGAGGSSSGPDFGPAIAAQQEAIAGADAAVGDIHSAVRDGIRFLSAGSDFGTAQYAAAKLVELTRIPAWSGDLEEFAHSQYWSMPTSQVVAVIAADPVVAPHAERSCAALAELGVTTLAVDTAASPVASAAVRVTLPAIDAALAPLATAVPAQILAYALAEAAGLDPNARTHLKSDAARFRVSRLLTRRSLVGTGG